MAENIRVSLARCFHHITLLFRAPYATPLNDLTIDWKGSKIRSHNQGQVISCQKNESNFGLRMVVVFVPWGYQLFTDATDSSDHHPSWVVLAESICKPLLPPSNLIQSVRHMPASWLSVGFPTSALFQALWYFHFSWLQVLRHLLALSFQLAELAIEILKL